LSAISLWPMLVCSAAIPDSTTLLEGRVVDDAAGEPVAARVAITNAHGKFVEIEGEHAHVQYLDKRWCYVNGSFTAAITDSETGIEIRRGFEVRPLLAALPGGDGAKTLRKTFRLQRWINTEKNGFFNGDIHAHLPVPREAYL